MAPPGFVTPLAPSLNESPHSKVEKWVGCLSTRGLKPGLNESPHLKVEKLQGAVNLSRDSDASMKVPT